MKVGDIGRYQIDKIINVYNKQRIDAQIVEIPYAKNELFRCTADSKTFEINGKGELIDGPIMRPGVILELLAEHKGELLSPYGLLVTRGDELKTKVVYMTDTNLESLK